MRLLTNLKTLVVMAVVFAGFASRMDAGTFLFPSLNPGDKFRLVFVTSTFTDAMSPDIDYYNSFVTNVANTVPALSALGATWTAIGSTSAVSAATNIGATDSGIYRLDGLEVAEGTTALIATSFHAYDQLMNPISINQLGDSVPTGTWTGPGVWTGISIAGVPNIYELGANASYVIVGSSASTGSASVYNGMTSPWYQFSLYAISSELTVEGEAAPEPATISLMALGGAFLLLSLRRKQQNHRAARTDRTPPAHD